MCAFCFCPKSFLIYVSDEKNWDMANKLVLNSSNQHVKKKPWFD